MDDRSLKHYGVLGMKWGVRRYQNKDGSLTSAGKRKYTNSDAKNIRKAEQKVEKYKKKLKRGSTWAVVGMAYDGMGYRSLANAFYNKSDKKYAKWENQTEKALQELKKLKMSELK